ncbi:hybrid sensor histidine kinase/response regulator [Rheinheimera sp.]|uniref:hybrid sensor histidine kinase/response regulator n=1 Tax=Rheinheimera sp. TaxID=1869214 RepID=UPI004048242F
MAQSDHSLQQQLALLTAQHEALKLQMAKQLKINTALISRVEAGSTAPGSPLNPYAAFEHAALLAEQVQQRTQELSHAYQALQQSISRSDDLQASERWTRTILDQVPAMIAYLSAQGRYLFTNLGYDTFYGVSRGSLQNAALQVVHGESGSRRLQPYIEQVIQGQAVSFEIDEFNAKGALRHLLKSYVPHKNETGAVIGFFVLNRDITERKQTSEALRQANLHLEQRVEERTAALSLANTELAQAHQAAQEAALQAERAQQIAESANHTKSKFLAAVSHDVLQPLNAARLFNGALLDLAMPVACHDLADSVRRSLDDLASLMRSLLDLSRLEAGAMPIHWHAISLADLMRKLDQEFQVQAQAKGIRLSTILCHATIMTDEGLLLRVLRNLLSNAVRYSQAGGRIVFGVRRTHQGLKLQVYDRGVGIAAELQSHIFTEFFRAEPHQEQGLGLGLAIVKRICQLLQMPLELKSHPGRGTMFAVTVQQTSAAVLVPATVAFEERESGCVWVIDNDDAILRGMTALLSGWGYEVIAVPDEAGLMQELSKQQLSIETAPVDALLVDYHLAQADTGLSLIQALQAKRTKLPPWVLISGDQSAELREQVRQMQGHWLSKPVRPLKLRLLLRQLLKTQFARPGS